MVSSARLPRTLVGMGGIRLISIPGVKYPDRLFQAEDGMNPRTGQPYDRPLYNTISTAEAAKILGRSNSSAHAFLRNKDVPFYYVRMNGDGRRLMYWDRETVKRMIKRLPPVQKKLPQTMVNARDALLLLGVARSTLYRYVVSGKLSEIRRRVMTTRGYRHQCLYLKSEVMKLKAWRRARREQFIHWQQFHDMSEDEVSPPEQVES